MDLSTLGSTLPPGLADAERDMGDKFRAAALSITNLYKSSLGYTKQAYNVGYSAALADVLSTVQSSIGAGQNAEQTLSRLMDWADARQAAISAFAAEDTDDAPAPPVKRSTAMPKQSLNHLNPPNRPASAPIPQSSNLQSFASRLKDDRIEENAVASSSRSIPPVASSSNSTTPNTSNSSMYQATPSGVMSSSPMASPSNNRPMFHHLPKSNRSGSNRHTQLNLNQSHNRERDPGPSAISVYNNSSTQSQSMINSNSLPSTTFNPSLPSAGVPFVSFTHQDNDGPAQNYSTGSKRPMIDSMEIDQSSSTTTINPITNTTTLQVQTPPSNNGRSSRASKRRSLGNSLNNDGDNEKDKDISREKDKDRERKKGSRRHGNGAGASAV
ncbi:uncharacterized protein L201_002003 [Kwoniella dendrophila CBS 6074]|uniref:Uncharacterized protein n=1 Tax=Kwoniella dendrophila CBS 6074 TaxID=1295534 RepID=A0AAX4JQY7_9TREE